MTMVFLGPSMEAASSFSASVSRGFTFFFSCFSAALPFFFGGSTEFTLARRVKLRVTLVVVIVASGLLIASSSPSTFRFLGAIEVKSFFFPFCFCLSLSSLSYAGMPVLHCNARSCCTRRSKWVTDIICNMLFSFSRAFVWVIGWLLMGRCVQFKFLIGCASITPNDVDEKWKDGIAPPATLPARQQMGICGTHPNPPWYGGKANFHPELWNCRFFSPPVQCPNVTIYYLWIKILQNVYVLGFKIRKDNINRYANTC